jgi:tetratricopeptide (TPR) repeat protein
MPTIDQLLQEAYTHWGDAPVLHRTGRELQDRNRLDHARTVLRRALELDDTNTDGWAYLAYTYLRRFAQEEGLGVLREGIAATDADSLRATLVGFTDDDEERRRLEQELEGTQDPGAQAGQLWSRFREGEAEEALAGMRELRQAHPDHPDLRDMFIWMLMAGVRSGSVSPEQIRTEGFPIAEERIAADPDAVSGYTLKIGLHELIQDWDGVMQETVRALARLPDEETLMQLRGRAHQQLGDLDRAVAWYSRAVGAKPSFVGARVELGKVYEQQERYELAEEIFREIPVVNPGYAPGRMSLALHLTRRGQLDEAETIARETWPQLAPWFQEALRQNPDARPLLERMEPENGVRP